MDGWMIGWMDGPGCGFRRREEIIVYKGQSSSNVNP